MTEFVTVRATMSKSEYQALRAYCRRMGRSVPNVAGSLLDTAVNGAEWHNQEPESKVEGT